MAKRKGFHPVVLRDGWGGEGGVIGGGSVHGGQEGPSAMSFDDWLLSVWAEDLDTNGSTNVWDYAFWWESWGFGQSDWESLNPGLSWDDYFG